MSHPLKHHYWLPVRFQAQFKVLVVLVTHKVLNDLGPVGDVVTMNYIVGSDLECSVIAPNLDSLPAEIRTAPSLVAF